MGRQNKKQPRASVCPASKAVTGPSTTSATSSSSSSFTSTISTTLNATAPVLKLASTASPPPPTVVLPGKYPAESFQAFPAEVLMEMAEWLDDMGANRTLLNLSETERALAECLFKQRYRTMVWYYKGKRQRRQQKLWWYYGMKSDQIKSIRHLVNIVDPSYPKEQRKHEIDFTKIQKGFLPELKSLAWWDRYDRNGKWGQKHNFSLDLFSTHQPRDFIRTLQSLHYVPTNTIVSKLKGAVLKVAVYDREQQETDMKEARSFFPDTKYGLEHVFIHPRKGLQVAPISLVAQFGGALSCEEWETTLVVWGFMTWGDKDQLFALVRGMIAINPRSFLTNTIICLPCREGQELPPKREVSSLMKEIGVEWFAATESCSLAVSITFKAYNKSGKFSMAKLSRSAEGEPSFKSEIVN